MIPYLLSFSEYQKYIAKRTLESLQNFALQILQIGMIHEMVKFVSHKNEYVYMVLTQKDAAKNLLLKL